LRQAEGILQATSEADPGYAHMRERFESENKANSSAEARLGRLFLAVPQAAYRIAELPVAAISNRREARPAKVALRSCGADCQSAADCESACRL
jgi:hypothetical protein